MHVITPTDGPEGSADQRVWRWSDEPTSVCQCGAELGATDVLPLAGPGSTSFALPGRTIEDVRWR
jgi:hypothetical protein